MRFGLESLSPPHASTIHRSPSASSSSSTCSLVAVDDDDDDSANDTEPQFPRVPETSALVQRPSLWNLAFDPILNKTGNTGNKTEQQTSANHSSNVLELKPFRRQLNFFFNMENQSTKRDSSRPGLRSFSCRSRTRFLSKDEPMGAISAARASICGKKFDRCELEFRQDRVQLTIWKDNKPRWRGDVKYTHIVRFCFSRADCPPYILLLQLNNANKRSEFATFYDPIFAEVCKRNDTKDQAISTLYGVVFYFDEALDYMRCQSMADNNPRLAAFFGEILLESETRQYRSLDALRMSRYSLRRGTKDSLCCDTRNHNFEEMTGNDARQKVGAASSTVTSFFRPTTRTTVLERDEDLSVVEDHDIFVKGRTLNLSTEGSYPDFEEEKLPILIADVGKGKQDCGSDDEGGETVVVSHTPREQSDPESATDALTSLPQSEMQSEIMKRKERAASSLREDEKTKRRRIESRRNEELLEYPYDGSDKLGRISVTLGDVDRLVPGEFLNDNIIDFYLRFLWRHLDSLQQQQMYFFTAHFFSQLNGTNGVHELSTVDPGERFARVARWTHKETNLFDKRFLFIPINDSFHWSLAVFCNPGSAIIKKHRKVKRCRVITDDCRFGSKKVVDLVSGNGDSIGGDGSSVAQVPDGSLVDEEIEEEELKSCQEDRLAHPPCLLFLDSLRCHRKKKFTKMLCNYLECEYKARFASSSASIVSKPKNAIGDNEMDEQETVVTVFDSDSIGFLEPNIPLQSNNSDCGVFLLMYAVVIVRLFPFGVTCEDLGSNLISTLTPDMFCDEHVLEFRDYLQQLLFCLQFLEKHGLPEQNVREEGLEYFAID